MCKGVMQYTLFDDMTQCTQQRVSELLMAVPDFRREQALRFHHVFGQFCCLQSWAMLQQLVSGGNVTAEAELPGTPKVHFNAYGKPSVDGFPQFSISHCRTAIAVAVAPTPIGIDVETIRQVDSALIERTMNEKEQRLIAAADDGARAFTRLWTQKEAFLKYRGTGIVDDLSEVLGEADQSRFTVLEYPNYILSVYC